VAAQIRTSVQREMEVVALMLFALTPWAAISVSVKKDSSEMGKCVTVSKYDHFYSSRLQLILSSFTFFFCKLIFPCSSLAVTCFLQRHSPVLNL